MATNKPRFTITVDPALLKDVEAFKCDKGIATQSKAIQQLLKRGVDSLTQTGVLNIHGQKQKSTPSVSEEAQRIAVAFDRASEKDKNTVRQVLAEYAVSPAAATADKAV